jgi:hypothetical protein
MRTQFTFLLLAIIPFFGATSALAFGTLPPQPINPVGATNCATYPGPAHNNPLSVSVVTNISYPPGTVTVDWYDAGTNGNRVAISTTSYTPTNNPDMIGWNIPTNYIYYAEARDLATGLTSAKRTPATLQINPLPSGVPVSNGNQTNCVGVANSPLTVTDTNSVIWYDSSGNVVASFTNSFTPTNRTLGVWTYYSAEVNASGCTNGNILAVNLVLVPCTNQITSITTMRTNALVSWNGNYVLQSTTNLTQPVIWMNVSTGAVGPNTWTNSMVATPNNNFFRLYAPTN